MLFLYGELMVLLLVSFAFGAVVASFAMKALVKEASFGGSRRRLGRPVGRRGGGRS